MHRQEEDEEEAAQAQEEQEEGETQQNEAPEFDLLRDVLQEIQGYLEPADYKEIAVDDANVKELVKEFNDKVMQELVSIEEKIEEIRTSHPEAETTEPGKSTFTISKRSISSIEFLEDNEVDFDDWAKDVADNQWAQRTMKIFFSLNENHNKESWTLIPQVLDDAEFFPKAIDALKQQDKFCKPLMLSLISTYRRVFEEL